MTALLCSPSLATGRCPPWHEPASVPLLSLPSLAAGLLIVFGLVGVNANQAEESGLLGLIAFLAALIGQLLAPGSGLFAQASIRR